MATVHNFTFLKGSNHEVIMNNLVKEMEQAGIILRNVHHPRIKKLLGTYGYSVARLQVGQELLNQVELLQQAKKSGYQSKGKVSRIIRADEHEMHHRFIEHRALAKWIFRHSTDEYERFELHQPVASRKATKIAQIQRFYHEALKVSETFSRHGLPTAELEQGQAMIDSITEARYERLQKTGEAQQATQQRDEARRALRTWLADFRAVARVALRQEPQLLEALGMVVMA